jgi:hypothetical protein
LSKVLTFLMEAPHLCGANNPERHAKAIELIYKHELENPKSVFAINDLDRKDPFNREVLFGWQAMDARKKEHCKNLAALIMLSHRKDIHKDEGLEVDIDNLYARASADQQYYPDVAEYMTADQALRAWWNE